MNIYIPLRFSSDWSSETSFPPKDVSFLTYQPTVNYKKMAVNLWYKYSQFELWQILEQSDRVFDSEDCPCFLLNDLTLYDENDDKIDVPEPHCDDEFNSVSDDSSDGEFDSQELEPDFAPIFFTQKKRDELIDVISNAGDIPLRMFVQVLSAMIVGQCPAPACAHGYDLYALFPMDQTLTLAQKAKFEYRAVRTENVIDDVITQIKLAITYEPFKCLSVIVCALFKLRINDLLYLQDEIIFRFPFLAAVYSVINIEEFLPEIWTFFAWHSDLHWSFMFHADAATEDDYKTMPDWLSIRHSMHHMIRRAKIFNASPNCTEYAVQILSEFIKSTLQTIVEQKIDSNFLEISESDVVKALAIKGENRAPQTLYRSNSKNFQENPITMYSDSECPSYESSYSEDDLSDVEDLDEFVKENQGNILPKEKDPHVDAEDEIDSNSIDDNSEDYSKDEQQLDLNKLIKSRVPGFEGDDSGLLMQSAVQWAQQDLTGSEKVTEAIEEQENDQDESLNEESAINRVLDDESDRISDIMSKEIRSIKQGLKLDKLNWESNLSQEAYYYGHTDVILKEFNPKYEEDIPMHEMPEEKRAKIIALRRETNRIIEEEIDREVKEDLDRKFARMEDNYNHYDNNIREDALECKSMEINLSSVTKLQETVDEAIKIISTSKALKEVKLKWFVDEADEFSEIIMPLVLEVSKCQTVTSVIIEGCYFSDLNSIVRLLQEKKLTVSPLKKPE